jgi:hypothetical protein
MVASSGRLAARDLEINLPSMKPRLVALLGFLGAFVAFAAQTAPKAGETAKIPGVEIARPAKGFLGLQVSGGNFLLSFYDENRQPVPPAAARAVLRWTPTNRTGNEFYVLETAADGKALTSPKTVRPPYQFRLVLSLFAAGAENPFETHNVDFRQ